MKKKLDSGDMRREQLKSRLWSQIESEMLCHLLTRSLKTVGLCTSVSLSVKGEPLYLLTELL